MIKPPPDTWRSSVQSSTALRRRRQVSVRESLKALDPGRTSQGRRDPTGWASYTGGGMIGSTTVKLGPVSHVFDAVALPDIKQKPVYGGTRVGALLPRRPWWPHPGVARAAPGAIEPLRPVEWAPFAWTTLSGSPMYANGESKGALLVGASSISPPLGLRRRRHRLSGEVGPD